MSSTKAAITAMLSTFSRRARLSAAALMTLAALAAGLALAPAAALAYPTSGATAWTIAGDASACTAAPMCGDGGDATDAQLNLPEATALDASGNLYIADTDDNELRKVTAAGTIVRLAGTGATCPSPLACGDGGAASSAQLSSPQGVTLSPAGGIFVTDSGPRWAASIPSGCDPPITIRSTHDDESHPHPRRRILPRQRLACRARAPRQPHRAL